jgi:hypothetical protein
MSFKIVATKVGQVIQTAVATVYEGPVLDKANTSAFLYQDNSIYIPHAFIYLFPKIFTTESIVK